MCGTAQKKVSQINKIVFVGGNLPVCILESSGGGRVAKLSACGARGPGSIPRLATLISEIGYPLLPSRGMAELPLNRRKSSIQPTNQAGWYFRSYYINELWVCESVFIVRTECSWEHIWRISPRCCPLNAQSSLILFIYRYMIYKSTLIIIS